LTQLPRVLVHPKHSLLRKLLVCVEFLTYVYNLASGWLFFGMFLLFTDLNMSLLLEDNHPTLMNIYRITFANLIVLNFLFGMMRKPNVFRVFYEVESIILGIFHYTTTFVSIYVTLSGDSTSLHWILMLGLVLNLGVYFIVAILYGQFVTVVLSFWQWWFSTPTYAVILPIYAFCNLNDLSWGTKNSKFANIVPFA
jgi:chitin synthase